MRTLAICGAVCAALALGACGGGGGAKKEDAKVAKADAKKTDAKKADAKADAKEADEKPKDAAAEGPQLTHILFGRAKVADYGKWKEAFDKGHDKRAADGAVIHWVSQDPADPNTVMVAIGTTTGLDKLKAAMDSPEFKKANEEAGVTWPPEFLIMGEIKHGKPAPEGQKATGDLFVAHEVEDFDKWLEAFKKHEGKRAEASSIEEGVILAEGNMVGIHIGYTDEAKAKAFVESEDLKTVMKEAGVKGEPKIFWSKLAEEKKYDAPAAVAQK